MKRVPAGGYTIVEVMMFLVISGMLLVSATALISGREERARLAHSVRTFEQSLNDLANDVSTGYYETNHDITCTTNPDDSVSVTSGFTEQGTQDCLYVGKAIQFQPGSDAAASTYVSYVLAGQKNATSLADANVALLGSPGVEGIAITKNINADVRVRKIVSLADPSRSITGLAIISDFSDKNITDNSLRGNASRVTLYEVNPPFFGNAGNPSGMQIATGGVILCLQQSDDNGQLASVTIGGGGQLSIISEIGAWPGECN